MGGNIAENHWKIVIASTVGLAFAVFSAIVVLVILICRGKFHEAKRRREQMNERLSRKRWLYEQSNYPVQNFIKQINKNYSFHSSPSNNNRNNIYNNNSSSNNNRPPTNPQQENIKIHASHHHRNRGSGRQVKASLPLPRDSPEILQGPVNLNYLQLQLEKRQQQQQQHRHRTHFRDESSLKLRSPLINAANININDSDRDKRSSNSKITINNKTDKRKNSTNNKTAILASSSRASYLSASHSSTKQPKHRTKKHIHEFELDENSNEFELNAEETNTSVFNTIDSENPCLHRHQFTDAISNDNWTYCSGDDSGYSPMEMAEIERNYKLFLTEQSVSDSNTETLKNVDSTEPQRRYGDVPNFAFKTARATNSNVDKFNFEFVNIVV
ncbi:hypothetical protein HELRODRAFT_194036 [Helobdella robusta]|uniref:Uncharacterized protein n=1 Tax=Helobdella robusta TaxID=6412 RepID=T1FVL4_HELRO|nr:hypothetical protein HELRODRAFT_194036 [Helobdella robusta]ESN93501.1 hypothetical protein HELRODRAFT_194036 [Helobdella robusta]